MAGRSWGHERRRRRRLRILLPLSLLCALLLVGAELQLAPVLEAAAIQRTHSVALSAMTEAVNEQIALHPGSGDYQQLMYIERDNEGRITLMVTDTQLVNELISSVVLAADQRLAALEQQKLSLPLMTLSGSRVWAGLGPELHFSIRAATAPQVRIRDEFLSAGINQTRHSIYLELSCNIRLLAPFSRAESCVTATVLLAEGVIVGYTPDTYVNVTPAGR